MIEKIEWKGKTLALILRGDYEPEGVNFITPQDNPFQLGILKHRQGTRIKPHVHKKSPRTINDIQEVLHMEYGKVEVEFYDAEGRKLKSAILNSNDTILLLSGGHGFNILEDAKIIEVKQGPYYGTEGDKERLDISQEG
ncbi:MAG: hypothetical protein ACE5KP_00670 [Dehalococcoidales bacterium]